MKQILYSIFLFCKNLFLSLKIHLHIGSDLRDRGQHSTDKSKTNSEDNVN